ncbi:MAG: hypothetical protein FJ206_10500 [Gemmatimonadetes bacterium]|nr:hypothetical protein [Gemmatimonadota bacterium]
MRRSAVLPLIATFGGTALAAQSPSGSIRGIVYDSLVAGGPLVGALVELVELGRSTETDHRGVFRLDSLPGGRYTLTFSHRTLAAIGFSPPDKAVSLSDGLDISVSLATPSPPTIFARLCPNIREPKTGVLLGTIREAATDSALGGAQVRAEWTVTTLARTGGLVRQPAAVQAATDGSGRFQLCGVPSDVMVLFRALAGTAIGAALEVNLENKAVGVRHVRVDLSDSAMGRRARVSGRVTGAGQPLDGAQISVLGSSTATRSRSDGTFEISGLPGGSLVLEARMIGFGRRRSAIEIGPTESKRVDFSLDKAAVELPELTVAAASAAAARSGFEQRRLRGTGGFFITRADIVRRGSVMVQDIFKGVPGLKVDPIGGNDYQILSLRGGAGFSAVCAPTIYIDNIRIPPDPENGNDLPVIPSEIQGIEVHQSPHTVPLEFRPMGQNCGVILIWTRRGGP